MASSTTKTICRWTQCDSPGPYGSVQELADHVRAQHIDCFKSHDIVMCLWEGCRVYNVPCQKKSWLPQHMRRHTNERPYKCIMNGCNQSFSSVQSLHNHLQLHLLPSPIKKKSIKRTKSPPPLIKVGADEAPPAKKPCVLSSERMTSDNDSNQSETVRYSNGGRKKANLKIQLPTNPNLSFCVSPSPLSMNGGLLHNDMIDSKIMSVIQKAVVTQHLRNSSIDNIEEDKEVITLTGQIIGKRTKSNQTEQDYLIRWHPRITPDVWINQSEYTGLKHILISELLHCQRAALVKCSYFTKFSNQQIPNKQSKCNTV